MKKRQIVEDEDDGKLGIRATIDEEGYSLCKESKNKQTIVEYWAQPV